MAGAFGRKLSAASRLAISTRNSNTAADFWDRVDKSGGEESCWIFLGHRDMYGYGSFSFKRKGWMAHRFSWMLANGTIPDRQKVLHRCDNPGCVNPGHLFLGNQGDNMKDCVMKGRFAIKRGAAKPGAKLTDQAVQEIRRAHASGVTMSALSVRFQVSETSIGNIIKGLSWAHVPNDSIDTSVKDPEAIAVYIMNNFTTMDLAGIARCIRYGVPQGITQRRDLSISKIRRPA